MSSGMESELLDSDMGLEYDLHESDFGDDGLDEGSEEEEEEPMEESLISSRKDGEMIESYDRRELISSEVIPYMKPSDDNHKPSENVALMKVDLKPLLERKNSHNPLEKSSIFLPPHGNPELEPYEGLEFPSEEVARSFYYAYAKDLGFTVRISKCRRARDGSIVCRRFVCSKEGFYVRKYGRTKRSRTLTRVGCLARLIVKKLDSGVWVVVNFVKEHNHPPFVQATELNYEPPKPPRRGGVPRLPQESVGAPPLLLSKTEVDLPGSQSLVSWRFNKLHQEGIKLAEEGSSSAEIFSVAIFALREASQKVMAAKDAVMRGPQISNDDESCWGNEIFAQKNDERGSTGAGRRIIQSGGERNQFDDQDAAHEQEWDAEVAAGSNPGLSEAQVAALQAVAEAFNVPTLGSTSSSAMPVKVSPVTGDLDTSKRFSEFHELPPPRPPGPNPLVHAAAIAAGARIASPEVAASLLRAVHSRSIVHIRPSTTHFPKPQPPPPHFSPDLHNSLIQHPHHVAEHQSAIG